MNQLDAMFSRAVAAEELLAERQQSLRALTEANNLALSENSQLCERLAKGDAAFDSTRSQLEQAKTALSAAEARNNELVAAFDKASERHQIEINMLASRLETTSSHAVTAEKQLVAARHSLLGKFESLQNSLEAKGCRIRELEVSRAMLIESASNLLQNVDTRNKALANAEMMIKLLAERVSKPNVEAKRAN